MGEKVEKFIKTLPIIISI